MSGSASLVITPRVLLEGLAFPESPRWHEGRLWFSDWGTDEIIAVDLEGNQVAGRGSGGLGWAVNWLPGHRMLISGSELVRVEPSAERSC
jgi:sugar lactone lactonase YvrE